MGRNEDFFTKIKEDEKIGIFKGKIAKIEEDVATKDLLVEAEDALNGVKKKLKVNMVVLATGIVPELKDLPSGLHIELDKYGFFKPNGDNAGIFVAGCSKRPMEVSATVKDATGAAIKAIQTVVRS